MLFEIIKGFILFFLNLLKIPLFIICLIFFYFIAFILVYMLVLYVKGIHPIKSTSYVAVKKPHFLKALFIDLPKQIAYDRMTYDYDLFGYQGLIIYTGRQGYGKTMTLCRDLNLIQKEYTKCKIITNVGYKYEDDTLHHWKQLTDYKNGKYGVVAVIDETQNWFSSSASRNFPPEMLSVVTQNRKNKRLILGTAQNFYMLAKNIRTQCTEVRECRTFFKCLTIVRRRQPICDNSGEVVEMKKRGFYFFVQNQYLRDLYDTYKVIDNLSSSGFDEASVSKLS